MPFVSIEEVEDYLERLVGDIDRRVSGLELMDLEQPAVEVGHSSQEAIQLGGPRLRLTETLMEKANEEASVEGEERGGAGTVLDALKSMSQVVAIVVEEALLLDEVDEHQAVEHDGG